MSVKARRHLSVLGAIFLLILAFRAWLGIPESLTTQSGIVHGASFVDVYATIPVQWLLVAVSIVGAALLAWQVAHASALARACSDRPLMSPLSAGGGLYAFALQRLYVSPNEQVRELPFIGNSIRATRSAFALDRVEERGISGDATLTRADITRNAATLDNVPLWNDLPLLDTFGQIQEIRTYYDFHSVDNDRYLIDGKYRQIMLSARELNSESLPSGTWINERLTFTHGYGLTLGPVNEVTPEGLPVLFIQRSAAAIHGGPEGHPARDLFRRAVERPRLREDRDPGVRLPARRRERLRHLCRQRWSGAWAAYSAGCCSPFDSARPTRSSRRISPPTAGC